MNFALLISYAFPPFKSNSYRTYHIYQELQNHFSKVSVITSSNRRLLEKNIPIKDADYEHDLTQAFTLDHRSIRLLKQDNSVYLSESSKRRSFYRLLKLANSFPFNILVGEGGLMYILFGLIKALSIVKKGQQAFVLSSFLPYSDHIIAYWLKVFRPHVFWVADFRDLHIDPMLHTVYFPKFQAWCNQKILGKADVVTTVSKGLAAHLKPFHPNIVVLRNGFGELTNAPTASSQRPATTQFTITYTGSMFRDLRKPDLLLEAMSELFVEGKMDRQCVQILYAGKDAATWAPILQKYHIEDVFSSFGNISHEQAIALQRSSHINLLLTYASAELKGNATGKLYEYLSARQPILLLVNGQRDEELEEIIQEADAGLVVYNSLKDKELMKTFLLEKYNEWLSTGQVAPVIKQEALADFQWDNMLATFLENHVPKNLYQLEAPA